jgi:hypothetical protein
MTVSASHLVLPIAGHPSGRSTRCTLASAGIRSPGSGARARARAPASSVAAAVAATVADPQTHATLLAAPASEYHRSEVAGRVWLRPPRAIGSVG